MALAVALVDALTDGLGVGDAVATGEPDGGDAGLAQTVAVGAGPSIV